jgi:peptidoglycan hydrolase CwlO-like protein
LLKQIDAADGQIEDLEKLLAQKEYDIEELKKQLAERDALLK